MDKFQSLLHTTLLYFIYALALFPLLPRGVESVLMIAISALSVTYYILYRPKNVDKKKIGQSIVFGMLFFIYLFTLAYSDNLAHGLKYLKIVLPILIFPIVFGIFLWGTIDKKKLHQSLISIFMPYYFI